MTVIDRTGMAGAIVADYEYLVYTRAHVPHDRDVIGDTHLHDMGVMGVDGG